MPAAVEPSLGVLAPVSPSAKTGAASLASVTVTVTVIVSSAVPAISVGDLDDDDAGVGVVEPSAPQPGAS